jgi:hypothetical protein
MLEAADESLRRQQVIARAVTRRRAARSTTRLPRVA